MLKKIINRIKPRVYTQAKIKLKTLLGYTVPREYQERRSPKVKFEMMYNSLGNPSACKTLLDIGCNAGKVTAAFAEKGMFAVGIDINPRIIDYPENKRPIIGYFPFNDKSVRIVPNFDIILLLSVHHQWVHDSGDAHTQNLIAEIIRKAQQYMFIEFATLNEKYGYAEPRFDEGDEGSQKRYFESWLRECKSTYNALFGKDEFEFSYVGKNRERVGVEEFRHTYLIKKLSQQAH